MTTFSIVIPIYNVEKYIRKCLESVENQTFKDFEALCIDDCGNDNSIAIVEEFIQRDNRFKLLKHPHNMGLSAARNTAFDAAEGKYLICLDSDDWIDEKQLEKVYQAFEESNADSVWFNACVYEEEKGVYTPNYKPSHPYLNHRGFVEITPDNMIVCTDYVWDKAYRRSKINELNLRFPAGLFFEDAEFYFKTFTQITNIYYIDDILYYYRVRPGSVVQAGKKGKLKIKDMFDIFINIYNFSKEKGIFEKYKNTLLQLLGIRIKGVLLPNQYETVIRLAHDVFEKIDFPNAFRPEVQHEAT